MNSLFSKNFNKLIFFYLMMSFFSFLTGSTFMLNKIFHFQKRIKSFGQNNSKKVLKIHITILILISFQNKFLFES